MTLELKTRDVLTLRKRHPCGGYEWTVVTTGVEIGLVCNTCRHKIILPRAVLEKRIRKIMPAR